MKKYLFLLAFILPFMAMGQKIKQEIDSIIRHHHRAKGDFSLHRHEMDELDTTKQEFCVDGSPLMGGDTISIIMPIGLSSQKGYLSVIDKKKLDSIPYGVSISSSLTYPADTITVTPTKMTSQPEKDSIVKGYIFYAKKYAEVGGIPNIQQVAIFKGIQATVHYRVMRSFDDMPYRPKYWEIYKIEVDGKPFDMSKYYEFIPENQVVE